MKDSKEDYSFHFPRSDFEADEDTVESAAKFIEVCGFPTTLCLDCFVFYYIKVIELLTVKNKLYCTAFYRDALKSYKTLFEQFGKDEDTTPEFFDKFCVEIENLVQRHDIHVMQAFPLPLDTLYCGMTELWSICSLWH